jgi:hypothetical protein
MAIFGPWFFDTVPVPLSRPCSPPNVRVDGAFCGWPVSISLFYPELFKTMTELITGSVSFDSLQQWIILFALTLLLFPFMSIAILIIRGEHRSLLTIHRAVLGISASISVWIAWTIHSKASWVLWGLWLYLWLTIGMFILEILFASKTKQA